MVPARPSTQPVSPTSATRAGDTNSKAGTDAHTVGSRSASRTGNKVLSRLSSLFKSPSSSLDKTKGIPTPNPRGEAQHEAQQSVDDRSSSGSTSNPGRGAPVPPSGTKRGFSGRFCQSMERSLAHARASAASNISVTTRPTPASRPRESFDSDWDVMGEESYAQLSGAHLGTRQSMDAASSSQPHVRSLLGPQQADSDSRVLRLSTADGGVSAARGSNASQGPPSSSAKAAQQAGKAGTASSPAGMGAAARAPASAATTSVSRPAGSGGMPEATTSRQLGSGGGGSNHGGAAKATGYAAAATAAATAAAPAVTGRGQASLSLAAQVGALNSGGTGAGTGSTAPVAMPNSPRAAALANCGSPVRGRPPALAPQRSASILSASTVHSRPSSDLARKMEDIQNQINALTDDELMNPSAKLTFVPSPNGALGVPARLQSHSGAASMQTPHDAMQGVGQRLVQSSLHGGGTSAAGNGAGSGYTAAGNASGGQNRLAPGNHAGTGLASSGTLSGASRPISGQIQHMQFAMASIQEDPMLHSGTHGRPSVQHSIGSSMVLSRVGSANLQGRALPRDMPVEDREANVYRADWLQESVQSGGSTAAAQSSSAAVTNTAGTLQGGSAQRLSSAFPTARGSTDMSYGSLNIGSPLAASTPPARFNITNAIAVLQADMQRSVVRPQSGLATVQQPHWSPQASAQQQQQQPMASATSTYQQQQQQMAPAAGEYSGSLPMHDASGSLKHQPLHVSTSQHGPARGVSRIVQGAYPYHNSGGSNTLLLQGTQLPEGDHAAAEREFHSLLGSSRGGQDIHPSSLGLSTRQSSSVRGGTAVRSSFADVSTVGNRRMSTDYLYDEFFSNAPLLPAPADTLYGGLGQGGGYAGGDGNSSMQLQPLRFSGGQQPTGVPAHAQQQAVRLAASIAQQHHQHHQQQQQQVLGSGPTDPLVPSTAPPLPPGATRHVRRNVSSEALRIQAITQSSRSMDKPSDTTKRAVHGPNQAVMGTASPVAQGPAGGVQQQWQQQQAQQQWQHQQHAQQHWQGQGHVLAKGGGMQGGWPGQHVNILGPDSGHTTHEDTRGSQALQSSQNALDVLVRDIGTTTHSSHGLVATGGGLLDTGDTTLGGRTRSEQSHSNSSWPLRSGSNGPGQTTNAGLSTTGHMLPSMSDIAAGNEAANGSLQVSGSACMGVLHSARRTGAAGGNATGNAGTAAAKGASMESVVEQLLANVICEGGNSSLLLSTAGSNSSSGMRPCMPMPSMHSAGTRKCPSATLQVPSPVQATRGSLFALVDQKGMLMDARGGPGTSQVATSLASMHVENGVVVPKQGVAPMELIVLAVGGLVLLLNLTLMAYMLMSMQLLVHSGNAQHGGNGGEL